jgi:hypothetical protein
MFSTRLRDKFLERKMELPIKPFWTVNLTLWGGLRVLITLRDMLNMLT